MRVTYRSHGGNRLYWQKRWNDVGVDTGNLDLSKYPGRFSEIAMSSKPLPFGPILEAGCGTGRVVMHYHSCGKKIVGMDFISTALASIHKKRLTIPLLASNIANLPFRTGTFSCVLAFGLYHNLEKNLSEAIIETRRVMKKNAVLCASMRIDNIQNKITDYIANLNNSTKSNGQNFHKINLSIKELTDLFENKGFSIEKIEFVENMPMMYKIPLLRHKKHRVFNEQKARSEGYRLSYIGKILQSILQKFPRHFSNIAVIFLKAV